MLSNRSVLLNPAEQWAQLGAVKVNIQLVGHDGGLKINGDKGPYLKPVSFLERTRLASYASVASKPTQAMAKLVADASTEQTGEADQGIVNIIALLLAGANEDNLPSFTESAVVMSQQSGWTPEQLGSSNAADVDSLVQQFIPSTDDGWIKLDFSQPQETDLEKIQDDLARNLLSRLHISPQRQDKTTDINGGQQSQPGNGRVIKSELSNDAAQAVKKYAHANAISGVDGDSSPLRSAQSINSATTRGLGSSLEKVITQLPSTASTGAELLTETGLNKHLSPQSDPRTYSHDGSEKYTAGKNQSLRIERADEIASRAFNAQQRKPDHVEDKSLWPGNTASTVRPVMDQHLDTTISPRAKTRAPTASPGVALHGRPDQTKSIQNFDMATTNSQQSYRNGLAGLAFPHHQEVSQVGRPTNIVNQSMTANQTIEPMAGQQTVLPNQTKPITTEVSSSSSSLKQQQIVILEDELERVVDALAAELHFQADLRGIDR